MIDWNLVSSILEDLQKIARPEFDDDEKICWMLEQTWELAQKAEREACAKTRAGKPRELKPVGRGAFLDEQQFCFDKGWREGAASVRAAIRARGQA